MAYEGISLLVSILYGLIVLILLAAMVGALSRIATALEGRSREAGLAQARDESKPRD